MISTVFIRRPRLAIVISIVISIAGVIALGALPVAQFPDIVPPQVQVSATYPGASAAAVEESVALAVAGRRHLLAQRQPRRAVFVELRQDQHGRHLEAGARRGRRKP